MKAARLVLSGRYLLDPFPASQSPDAPYGLGDLIGLEEEVDPECRKLEDESCEDAQRKRHGPQEDVISEHQDFRVAAAAEDALGHDAVGCLEDDDKADRVEELVSDRDGFGGRFATVGLDDRRLRKEDEER